MSDLCFRCAAYPANTTHVCIPITVLTDHDTLVPALTAEPVCEPGRMHSDESYKALLLRTNYAEATLAAVRAEIAAGEKQCGYWPDAGYTHSGLRQEEKADRYDRIRDLLRAGGGL